MESTDRKRGDRGPPPAGDPLLARAFLALQIRAIRLGVPPDLRSILVRLALDAQAPVPNRLLIERIFSELSRELAAFPGMSRGIRLVVGRLGAGLRGGPARP